MGEAGKKEKAQYDRQRWKIFMCTLGEMTSSCSREQIENLSNIPYRNTLYVVDFGIGLLHGHSKSTLKSQMSSGLVG